jgi:hypothetical protein
LKGEDLDDLLLKEKLQLVRLLFRENLFSKPKIRAIFIFLNNYILFESPTTNRIFMREVDLITRKNNTMGILEQVAEMRAEDAREKALVEGDEKSIRLFLRHTEFSHERIAALVGVSIDIVVRINKELRIKS